MVEKSPRPRRLSAHAASSANLADPGRTDARNARLKNKVGITLVAERPIVEEPSTLAADDIVLLADAPAGSLKAPPWIGLNRPVLVT
jgi:hypothetical protein